MGKIKTNAVIVGVHDFVSQKGTPWRVIYANVSMVQDNENIGARTSQVFQGKQDDYFSIPADKLMNAECKIVSVGGKDAIALIPFIDV